MVVLSFQKLIMKRALNPIKNVCIIILAGLSASCATMNVAELQMTDKDNDTLASFDKSKSRVRISKVLIISTAASSLGKAYAESITSATYELASTLGGTKVIDRSQVKNILKEVELQQTGLIDQDDAIEAGKMSGAQYIITSALINATAGQVYHQATRTKKNYTKAYWQNIVEASIDFKVIDMATSDVLMSKVVSNKYSKSTDNRLNNESLLSLLPPAIKYVFEDVKPELQRVFPLRSIIIALRGGKKAAMIPLGAKQGMAEGRKFDIINNLVQDTVVGKKSISQKIGKLTLVQVEKAESWGEISGDNEKVKIGMDVASQPEEVSTFKKVLRKVEVN